MNLRKSRALNSAVWLGLGCILFAFLLFRMGAGEIFSVLLEVRWNLAGICALYASHLFIRTLAFQQCVTERRVTFWDLFLIRLFGETIQLLTSTGPFFAEPAKALLMRRQGFPLTQAFSATILEYLFYTFTSAAMAIFGLTYLLRNFEIPRAISAVAVIVIGVSSAYLVAAAVAITGQIYLIGAVIGFLSRIPLARKLVRIDEAKLRETEDLLFAVLRSRPSRFLRIVGIECVAQSLLVLEVFVFLRATGHWVPSISPFLIESAAKFISIGFFFIPAQVGAAEGVYAVIFQAVGLTSAAGFSFALARRLRSVLILGIGFGALFLMKGKRRAPATD